MNRRAFLQTAASAAALPMLRPLAAAETAAKPRFPISLAQYSLHRRIWGRDGAAPLDPLGFPAVARVLGIDAVEYVSMLWRETFLKKGMPWVEELRRRADEQRVGGVLLMIDREGSLGARDSDERNQAIADHARYLAVAKALGCSIVRVDPKHGGENHTEALGLLAGGIRALCERADDEGIDVLVENEAGFGAEPEFLVELVEEVDHPRFGLLPDFGNVFIDPEAGERSDPYELLAAMMPHARAVSAKSFGFEPGSHISIDRREGRELELDFDRLMEIVLDAGYRGHVGIEYEGEIAEIEGIRQTRDVLREIAAR